MFKTTIAVLPTSAENMFCRCGAGDQGVGPNPRNGSRGIRGSLVAGNLVVHPLPSGRARVPDSNSAVRFILESSANRAIWATRIDALPVGIGEKSTPFDRSAVSARPYYGSRRMAAWLATPAKPKNRGSANRFSRRAKARHRPGLRNPPENSRNRRSTPVSGIETLGGTFDVKKPIDYLS
jgi:hypothetical protein